MKTCDDLRRNQRHSEPNATDTVHFLLGQWIMHRSRNGFSNIHNRLRYTFHHTLHFRIQSRSSSQSRSRMRQPSFTSEWRTVTKLTSQPFKDGFDSHCESSLVLPVKVSPVLLKSSGLIQLSGDIIPHIFPSWIFYFWCSANCLSGYANYV